MDQKLVCKFFYFFFLHKGIRARIRNGSAGTQVSMIKNLRVRTCEIQMREMFQMNNDDLMKTSQNSSTSGQTQKGKQENILSFLK